VVRELPRKDEIVYTLMETNQSPALIKPEEPSGGSDVIRKGTHAALYSSYIHPVQLALENTLDEYWVRSEVDPEMRAVKKVLELAVWEVFRDAGRHRSEVPLL